MNIFYDQRQTKDGYTYPFVIDDVKFCCEKMRMAWKNEQIGFEYDKEKDNAPVTNVRITHDCQGWEVDSVGFDISYCPFCGTKIEPKSKNQ